MLRIYTIVMTLLCACVYHSVGDERIWSVNPLQAAQRDRTEDSWASLARALTLDKQRLASIATADNIHDRVVNDPRFTDVRRLPGFKAWQP